MKAKVLFAATLFATSAMSFAESYQSDVSVTATRDTTDGVSSKENSYEVFGQYFFKPVETSNRPYAEAAYLGKASNIFAHALEVPPQNGYASSQVYTVGAEVYVPENFLYVSVAGQQVRCCGANRDNYSAILGVTPIDGLRVTSTYNNKVDYRVNLDGKYVTAIGDGQFINLEASYYDGKGDDTVSVGGDFYFDRTFSLGGTVTDYGNDQSYEVRVRKFFTPTFGAELAYVDYPNGSSVAASVDFRF